MIDDEDHVELTGIMFRKLGGGIEENIYGVMPYSVNDVQPGDTQN